MMWRQLGAFGAVSCVGVVALALVALALVLYRPPRTRPLVFVINLPKNRVRLNMFETAYRASDMAHLPLTKLHAIDGSTVDWTRYLAPEALEKLLTVRKSGTRTDHPDLTPGAVGCYLSHLEAWNHIAASHAPYGIVFEDDASPPPDTLATLHRALQKVPKTWDLVLLGWEGEGEPVGPTTMKLNKFLRLHAYAISRSAATRLCASMLPIRRQLDWELNTLGLDVYGVYPSKVKVRWQGTDVQVPLRK